MWATLCYRYGPPEVIHLAQVPRPVPKSHEILVRIHASSVNSGDVRVRGLQVGGFLKPLMRLVLGFSKPRKPILGTVFSGTITQVGAQVTLFHEQEEVFGLTGFQFGCHAEYLCISQNGVIARKPQNLSHLSVAALCFGGQTAYYFLNKAKIKTMTQPQVLIYGASGSVGTAAVQMAKFYGAQVTAICGEIGVSLVRNLGVDSVYIYHNTELSKIPGKFDIIFDAVGKISKKQISSLLKPKGIFKTVGGLEVASESIEQLEFIKHLLIEGRIDPTIEKIYTLPEIVEAHKHVDSGRKKGNVVIEMIPKTI